MATGLNCRLAVVDGASSQARHVYFDVQHYYQNLYAICQRFHPITAWLFHFILHACPKPRALRHNGQGVWQIIGDDDWRV